MSVAVVAIAVGSCVLWHLVSPIREGSGFLNKDNGMTSRSEWFAGMCRRRSRGTGKVMNRGKKCNVVLYL
jgi:hypothetical protein